MTGQTLEPVAHSHRRFYWEPGLGLREGSEHRSRVLAADSWFVLDGTVRAIDRHRSRFGRACAEQGGPDQETVDRFWKDVVGALPRQGDWFPKVELLGRTRPRLSLLIRTAPVRGSQLRVLPLLGSDNRKQPRLKGPDLDLLAATRAHAVRSGADEALLTTPSGLVIESTTSALLWWDGEDLCVPSPRLRVLPSVTASLLVERAHDLGVRVRPRTVPLQRLDGCETWLVNALHGIRVVSAWTGSPVRPGKARRAAQWNGFLDALRQPLPAAPAPPVFHALR